MVNLEPNFHLNLTISDDLHQNQYLDEHVIRASLADTRYIPCIDFEKGVLKEVWEEKWK